MKGELYWDEMTKTYWKMIDGNSTHVQPQGHPNAKFKFIMGWSGVAAAGWFEEVPGSEPPRLFTSTATGV